MPKLTWRRGVWSAVAVFAVVVLSGSAYLLTYKHPEPRTPPVVRGGDGDDLEFERERAKKLPEYAELYRLNAQENWPITPEAVARFGELAGHPNYWIRILAVGFLGNAPESLRAAAAAHAAPLLKDANHHVRAQAVDALARLGAKDRIPDLVAFLGSPDPDERARAKRALRRLGHPVE